MPLANNPLFRTLFMLRKVFLTKASKRYYSQYGEDIVYDRVINLKQPGFFVDVGCYHPVKYNNTYKLYRRGWRGINLDLDAIKVRAFNLRRPGDTNIQAAVSDKDEEVTLYSFGMYSLVSTIDEESGQKHKANNPACTEQKVRTQPLTAIIDGTKYKDRLIDVLSIDVEGMEMRVLSSLDFDRYQPKVVVVESHERAIDDIIQGELYQFLIGKGYTLFNWTGPSLLFLHPRKRPKT